MRQILLIDCNDEKGLVSKISTALFHRNANIISNREYVDPANNRFFMRTEYEGSLDPQTMYQVLGDLIPKDANVRIESKRKKRLVIMATKEPHCLGDLLIRCAYSSFNAQIEAVVSNHELLQSLVAKFDIPFHFVDHNHNIATHLTKTLSIIEKYNPDWIILAKYMQILPPEFVQHFKNRIINIHHSFLPAFVGANPYHQAHERGVKIIGATAHFVTEHLDQGPIICQDVISVNHRYSAKDMAAAGRDVEKIVLSRALQLAVNECIFINDNKTVVFD